MEPLLLFAVFIGGIIASAYGTLLGGASLLTIPLLIVLGLPAHVAVATNRTGLLGLALAGWYKFHKKKTMNYSVAWLVAIFSGIGAFLGANLVVSIDEAALEIVVSLVTLAILALMLANPKAGIEELKKRLTKRHYILGSLACIFIGGYMGFYGAGGGTFYSYLLILLFGQTFIQAAATRKIAGALTSLVAAAVFFYNGLIDFPVAIVLLVGSAIGSYAGAHYSDRIGNRWVKYGFAVVVVILSLRLLL